MYAAIRSLPAACAWGARCHVRGRVGPCTTVMRINEAEPVDVFFVEAQVR
jgi:hypothetical protein